MDLYGIKSSGTQQATTKGSSAQTNTDTSAAALFASYVSQAAGFTGAVDPTAAMGQKSTDAAKQANDTSERPHRDEAAKADHEERGADEVAANDEPHEDDVDGQASDGAEKHSESEAGETVATGDEQAGSAAVAAQVVANTSQTAPATQTAQTSEQATKAAGSADAAAAQPNAAEKHAQSGQGSDPAAAQAAKPAAPQDGNVQAAPQGQGQAQGQVQAQSQAPQAATTQVAQAQPQAAAAQAATQQAADPGAAVAAQQGQVAAQAGNKVSPQAKSNSEQAQGIAKAMGKENQGHTVKVEVQTQTVPAPQTAPQPQATQAAQATAEGVDDAAPRLFTQQSANYYSPSSGQGAQGGQSLGHQTAQATGQNAAQTAQQAQQNVNGQTQQAMAAPVAGQQAAAMSTKGGDALPTAEVGAQGASSATAGVGSTASASTNAFVPNGATGVATTGQGAGATATAHQSTAQAQSQSAAAHQAVDQVKVKITQHAASGEDTIRIQLKPAEMGRVDVKLHLQDGRVSAHVTADSQETLDALKADSRGLERALNDAGLKTDSGSLSFSLRSDGGAQMAQGDGGASGRGMSNPYGGKAQSLDDDLDTGFDIEAQRSQIAAARGGVDIRV